MSPAEETWAMKLESSEKQQNEHENTTHGMGSNISRVYTCKGLISERLIIQKQKIKQLNLKMGKEPE